MKTEDFAYGWVTHKFLHGTWLNYNAESCTIRAWKSKDGWSALIYQPGGAKNGFYGIGVTRKAAAFRAYMNKVAWDRSHKAA
jgi:uncharacterized protein YjcR